MIQIIKENFLEVNIKNKKERYAKIYEKKKTVDIDLMCMGVDQLIKLYKYIRNLKFEETPDYNLILGLISELYEEYKSKDV